MKIPIKRRFLRFLELSANFREKIVKSRADHLNFEIIRLRSKFHFFNLFHITGNFSLLGSGYEGPVPLLP